MKFPEFFRAVWGPDKEPFPWQEDLAEQVLRGGWPSSIGLPTAAGKTALLDIAVFALAMGAPGAARRIFFVVDRRVIVDEAAQRAADLSARLAEAPPGSELGRLAQQLRELGHADTPLEVATIRGGIPRDYSWAGSPLQPAIVCSTVDQIGSSLLYRAYGASHCARPIRASLAAYDSLIILDEAHTSQPFAETLSRICHYRLWADEPLTLPFQVVEMSATPRQGIGFHESDRDRRHPLLKKRWETEKRAKLVTEEPEKQEERGYAALVRGLAREARALRDRHGAKVIGVIANRVGTARSVFQALAEDADCDAILLTGRARPWARDRLWQEWKSRIGMGRKAAPERTIFVVATQCIEVGANLDFDGLVTEIASIDALEQRFGRLARDGSDTPRYAAIVAQKPQIVRNYVDAVYGNTLGAVWRWLHEYVVTEVRTETVPAEGKRKAKTKKTKIQFVPMGVLALRQALQATPDRQSLTMPRQSAPVLMPAHLDLLSQTSPEPAISPEPALFLHGPESGPADVQVVWRMDPNTTQDPELWKDIVAICPPAAAEAVTVPVWAVRAWLVGETAGEVADIEGLRADDVAGRNGKRPVIEWRGGDESIVRWKPEEIRPGAVIVVPAAYGGCDKWGWNPESPAPVDDIGDAVKLQMGRPILRLHEALAEKWGYRDFAARIREAESAADARAAIAEALDQNAEPWVREVVKELFNGRPRLAENPVDGGETWTAIVGKAGFDQGSVGASYTVEVSLDRHLRGCAGRAQTFASGLPDRVRQTIIRAAEFHDIGKSDPRFQAWLRGGVPVKPHELIAKSGRSGQNPSAMERARNLAGYPKGGRHELTSVALLASHESELADVDFDLLLHLIASHHGRCRPFAPVVEDGDSVQVIYTDWSAPSDHRMDRANSGISERFWRLTRRYGWYGLSFLETLVRLADQRESEEEREDKVAEAARA